MPAHKKNHKGKKGKSHRKKSGGELAASAFLGTKAVTVVKKESFNPVVWVDLAAGSYLVSASGTVNRLSNSGSDLLIQARLTAGGVTMPFMYFHGPTANPASSAEVDLAGRIDLTKKGRVAVECSHYDFADTQVEAIDFELFAQEVTVQDND